MDIDPATLRRWEIEKVRPSQALAHRASKCGSPNTRRKQLQNQRLASNVLDVILEWQGRSLIERSRRQDLSYGIRKDKRDRLAVGIDTCVVVEFRKRENVREHGFDTSLTATNINVNRFGYASPRVRSQPRNIAFR